MVLDYYKLSEQPFGVTPDPRFLYLRHTHREALTSVQYGVTTGRGFTALIARPGMGKTTLLFDFLSKVSVPAQTVFLFQSQPTPRYLLMNVLEDLGLQDHSDDIGVTQRKLNDCLVSESMKAKPVIVVIDEAQNLDENVLEVVRMLSNFETSREKLMHLVLAGQPRLAEMLATPKLEQLRQRISIIARLQPFNAEETYLYIDHRLRVAGYESDPGLFTKQALALIVENSGGIPRNINNLCFNAMSLACAVKAKRIEADVLQEVIRDLRLDSHVENTPEGVKPETKHALLPRATKSPWFSGWHRKLAVPLGLLAVLGGSLTWKSRHSAQVIDPLKFPLQVGLAAASVPSSIALTEVSAMSPKQFVGAGNIAESPKAKTLNSPLSSNLRTHLPQQAGLESTSVVIVQPNQTMYRICIEALGRYVDATKTKIRELNPGLLNLDQIRLGQSIRLPARDAVRGNVRASAEQERITANQAANR